MVRVLQALFGNLTLDVIVLTMLYSTAGLGIAIVNDFKSIEGDRYAFPAPTVNLLFHLVNACGEEVNKCETYNKLGTQASSLLRAGKWACSPCQLPLEWRQPSGSRWAPST